jgi:hypothetical protein
MNTPAATVNPPARRVVFRRFFGWRTARILLMLLAALITLGALFFAEEHWRCGRAWEDYKRAMEAKGERFDAARLIPPKVPEDQNFAMTPLFARIFSLPPDDPSQPLKSVANTVHGEIFLSPAPANLATNIDLARFGVVKLPPHPVEWQWGMAADLPGWAAAMQGTNPVPRAPESTDPVQAASIILDKLKASEPLLAELQSAAARPYCWFNIPYEEWDKPDAQSALMAHFTLSKWLFRFLSLHAQAELVLGRTDQALNDILVMFRVDDGLKDEPLLISQLVRMANVATLLQPIGEGLAEQRWADGQLRVLQERLQKTDLIASSVLGLYGERDICSNRRSHSMGYMVPPGWDRLEQINLCRGFQEAVFSRINLAAREVNPSVNHSIDLAFQKSRAGPGFGALLHHNLVAAMTLPVFSRVPQKAALAQSEVDMGALACALERYRLAQGQYPEDLNALVPRFVALLPHDIINGQPLKYRRTDHGQFILYSVGWNEKDDGGVVATIKADPPRQDILQGDWVWQYPEKN